MINDSRIDWYIEKLEKFQGFVNGESDLIDNSINNISLVCSNILPNFRESYHSIKLSSFSDIKEEGNILVKRIKKENLDLEKLNNFEEFITNLGTKRQNLLSKDNGFKELSNHIMNLIDDLEVYKLKSSSEKVSKAIPQKTSNKVFIVHGHDEELKQKVVRFVTQLKLEPIILHEQPNQGQTIVEKFEKNSSDIAYAIILATKDDEVICEKDTSKKEYRARQNVIFELGYFCGCLGRANISVLYEEEVTLPSDYNGIIYIKIDEADAWKTKIAQEMKKSGLDIDLNNL